MAIAHPIVGLLTGDGKTFYFVRKFGNLKAISRADKRDMKAIEARDLVEAMTQKEIE